MPINFTEKETSEDSHIISISLSGCGETQSSATLIGKLDNLDYPAFTPEDWKENPAHCYLQELRGYIKDRYDAHFSIKRSILSAAEWVPFFRTFVHDSQTQEPITFNKIKLVCEHIQQLDGIRGATAQDLLLQSATLKDSLIQCHRGQSHSTTADNGNPAQPESDPATLAFNQSRCGVIIDNITTQLQSIAAITAASVAPGQQCGVKRRNKRKKRKGGASSNETAATQTTTPAHPPLAPLTTASEVSRQQGTTARRQSHGYGEGSGIKGDTASQDGEIQSADSAGALAPLNISTHSPTPGQRHASLPEPSAPRPSSKVRRGTTFLTALTGSGYSPSNMNKTTGATSVPPRA